MNCLCWLHYIHFTNTIFISCYVIMLSDGIYVFLLKVTTWLEYRLRPPPKATGTAKLLSKMVHNKNSWNIGGWIDQWQNWKLKMFSGCTCRADHDQKPRKLWYTNLEWLTYFCFSSLTSTAGLEGVGQGNGVEQAVLARLTDSLCRSNWRITFESFSCSVSRSSSNCKNGCPINWIITQHSGFPYSISQY